MSYCAQLDRTYLEGPLQYSPDRDPEAELESVFQFTLDDLTAVEMLLDKKQLLYSKQLLRPKPPPSIHGSHKSKWKLCVCPIYSLPKHSLLDSTKSDKSQAITLENKNTSVKLSLMS
ncbi:hypothetical protein LCGC14_2090890 [marine sediment metagenome]|uniref:Uncharacterized protein n=1 Tax=marine sediment metagenome TaxID=412755 RepID=A0A0F9GQZ0_9ZZZZ